VDVDQEVAAVFTESKLDTKGLNQDMVIHEEIQVGQ